MPVYDYLCKDCQHSFETTLTLAEHENIAVTCPKCKSKNVMQEPTRFYPVTAKKSA